MEPSLSIDYRFRPPIQPLLWQYVVSASGSGLRSSDQHIILPDDGD